MEFANRPPRVAVVIPCYNNGRTLAQAIASVRGQECELVVVDDGSDDALTLEVLHAARATGVHVIRQENSGPAAARWAGVRATTAPYVFALDADDLMAPGALADLADALDAHPDLSFASGDISDPDDPGRVGRPAADLDPWLVTYLNPMAISLYRRSALEATGGWRGGGVHEDWDLWLTFAELGHHGIRIPRVIYYYRRSPGSRWEVGRRRYNSRVLELRAAHPALYAARRSNWFHSSAPLRTRILLPTIALLPLTEANKRRLFDLVWRPRGVSATVARRTWTRLRSRLRLAGGRSPLGA